MSQYNIFIFFWCLKQVHKHEYYIFNGNEKLEIYHDVVTKDGIQNNRKIFTHQIEQISSSRMWKSYSIRSLDKIIEQQIKSTSFEITSTKKMSHYMEWRTQVVTYMIIYAGLQQLQLFQHWKMSSKWNRNIIMYLVHKFYKFLSPICSSH